MSTNDKLREALERMDRARSILTDNNPRPECNWGMLDTSDLRAALAASKPEPKSCHKRSNGYCDCERNAMLCDGVGPSRKPEPQAQAGEPEVVAIADGTFNCGAPVGSELITLQAHREAMAKLEAELNLIGAAADKLRQQLKEEIFGYREANAKKDAALDACVEALRVSHEQMKLYMLNYKPGWNAYDANEDAITQAQEARK